MALQAGEVVATFSLDLGSLDRSVRAAEKALGGIGKTLGGLGLTAMVTKPVLAAAGDILRFGQDFEAEMDRVGAILNLEGLGMSAGAAAQEMDRLRGKALEMGETTSLTASRAAEAMEALAMAGWGSGDIEKAIEPLIRLSEVSGTGDLQETASIVADTLTALGEGAGEAGRLSDVLTAAATGSNTDLTKLGTTFKYVASMAGTLGFSMEDLALASGLMANAGIKAQKAGTGLRALLNRMSSNKKAKEAMESLGLSLYDTEGKAKSLRDVMGDLRKAFAGLTDEEKTQAAYMLGGTSGMNAVLAIAGATEESFVRLAESIDHSGGTAVRTASGMLDNLKGDLTLLDSALGTTKILLAGTVDEIGRSAVQKLTGAVRGFNGLGEEGLGAAVKLAALAAAAGPCVTALGVLETASAALLPGLAALISPAGLLTAGLAALGAAALSSEGDLGRLLEKAGEGAAGKLRGMEKSLLDVCAHIEKELPGLLESAASAVSAVLPELLSLLSSAAVSAMNLLSGNMEGIAAVPRAIVKSLADGISRHAGELTGAAVSLATSLLSGFLASIPDLAGAALSLAEGFGKALVETDWESVFRTLEGALRTCMEGLGKVLEQALSDLVLPDGEGIAESLSGALEGAGQLAATALEGWSAAAQSALEAGFSALSTWLSGDGAKNVLTALTKTGGDLASAVADALANGLTGLSGILSAALTALASVPVDEAAAALGELAVSLWGSFATVFQAAASSALNLTETLGALVRSIDWEKTGAAVGETAVQLISLMASALAEADLGQIISSLISGILSAAEGLTEMAGAIIEKLVAGLLDLANLAHLLEAGGKILESLFQGILSGVGRLAETVVNGIANLLGPAFARLFGGTFESETKEIEIFRNTRFHVDPALFGEAEKTGREVEEMLSTLLLPGSIASEADLGRVTALYDTLAREGGEVMIRLTQGLSRYGQSGFTDLFGNVLHTLERGGDLERAGQEAAILYMAGFGETVQGAVGAAGSAQARDAVLDAMEGMLRGPEHMDAFGFIDVGEAARSLSLDLSSVLGFALPEGYRLAFNGMETELQEITEGGLRSIARSASFEGLFDGADIWGEIERTTLSGLGGMAEALAGQLQEMGISSGALLGKTLSESTLASLQTQMEAGNLEGAAASLLAGLGLQEAGEAMRTEIEGAKGEAAGAGAEIAAAADPGKSMTDVFSKAGSEAAGAAAQALSGAAPEVTGAVSGLTEAAVLAFEERMTADEGRRIAEGFVKGALDGVKAQTGPMAAALSTLGAAASSALAAALPSSTAYGIGSRFAQGLAAGLRSGMGAVASAAQALSQGASGTVRGAWQIHSPSRVAEEMGGQFVAGLVRGLSVTEEIRKAALALASGMQIAGNGVSQSVRSVGAGMARLETGSTWPVSAGDMRREEREEGGARIAQLIAAALSGLQIQMDGRAVGETVAPSVSEIMAARARERRFGG